MVTALKQPQATDVSNYDMANECITAAERNPATARANYEVASAQVFATLALVDAIRELKDSISDEVSDALVDTLRYREIGVKDGAA